LKVCDTAFQAREKAGTEAPRREKPCFVRETATGCCVEWWEIEAKVSKGQIT